MSQENVEVVRRFYGFFGERDYSMVEELIHPDAVLDVSRNVFNAGVHSGIDAFRSFVEGIDEVWEEFRVTPEEILDGGETIVVGHRIAGKGRGSGVETEMLLFGVVQFSDGRILRFTGGFRDRGEALEAAGLSE